MPKVPKISKTKTVEFPLKQIVQVRWRDASTMSAWHGLDEFHEHEPANCQSVGYLLKIDKGKLILMQTISEDGQGNCGIAIPKDWVINIKALGNKVAAKRRKVKK